MIIPMFVTFLSLVALCLPKALWAAPVPDMLISMPSTPEASPQVAIVVEKSTQTLSVYRYDGEFRKVATYACSTGKTHGDKQISGDMKTPEGVYFFTDHHKDGDLAPVYGSRAFPLNYPNVVDRHDGKGGFAIWLHGTDRPLVPHDSNGCVAMNNQDIDRLATVIDLERTPILIAETLHYMDAGAAASITGRLFDFLDAWRLQLCAGTYQQYLALYHPDYLPPIDWWRIWQTFRRETLATHVQGGIDLIFDDASFYRDRNTFVAAFRQTLRVGTHSLPAGRRLLYIRDTNAGLRIVGDNYHRIGAEKPQNDRDSPLIAAVRGFQRSDGEQARIAAFVKRWLAAWSDRDLVAYGACYADDFTSKRMTKRQWLKYKQSLNETYSRIQVSARNLSYRVDGNTAVVTFTQRYASDRYRSEGLKTLHLRREKDLWKISREIFNGN